MLKTLSNYFLTLSLVFIISLIIFINDGVNYSFKVLFTSFLICTFSIIKVFSKSEPLYSLNSIFYLFILFFIGLAPAIQFKNAIFFLGEKSKLSETDFFFGNILFMICIIIYSSLYFGFQKKFLRKQIKLIKRLDLEFNTKKILIIAFITAFIVFVYFSANIEALFTRKFLWYNKAEYQSPFLSIINVVRSIPLLLFIYFKCSSNNKNLKIEITLLVLIVLCNFPLGIPRYKLAVIYLPILIIYFKILLKKQTFALVFITLFLSVFPYLDHFRYNIKLMPEKIFDFEMFQEAHFDSYQNSINVITKHVVTNGNQLFGTVLFFIPRSLWETKSSGSGYVLAEKLNYDGFSNVAVSYFAEGYINFGYIGVFIFVVCLALVNAYIDYSFWNKNFSETSFKVFYLIFLPFQFFVLRGSLMSSIANLIGFLVCIIIIRYLLVLRNPLHIFKY